MHTAKIENIEIECTQIFFPKNIKPNEAEKCNICAHMHWKIWMCSMRKPWYYMYNVL